MRIPIGRRCIIALWRGREDPDAILKYTCDVGVFQNGQTVLFSAVVNDMGNFAAKFITMHNSVNKTMFHQELAALKALR